jgi:S1-C subfamily serine protease
LPCKHRLLYLRFHLTLDRLAHNTHIIVTNYHIVNNWHTSETVYFNGDNATAHFAGGDLYANATMTKVNEVMLAVAKLGDSNTLKPRETVIAISSAK